VRLSDGPPDRVAFLEGFAAAHRREYGYDVAGRPVEVVNCRLKVVGLIERPAARFAGGARERAVAKSTRAVHFDSGWIDTLIYDRSDLPIGALLSGPAVINEMSATTLVPSGWTVRVDPDGNLMLETV